MRRSLLVALSAVLLACPSNDAPPPPPARTSAATTSSAPTATASSGATAAPPSASASAPAVASASASASAAAASPEPSKDEWEKASEVRVSGSTALGCETKRVREWVRVLCEKPNDTKGTPTDIKLKKAEIIRPGEPIVQTRKEVKVTSTPGSVALVTRFVDGVDVEADLTWSDKEKHLSIFWPGGKPEPLYAGAFK